MSHFSEIKTKITHREHLLKALKNLGLKVETAEMGVEVRGFMGNISQAEFKVLTDTHYDIGFTRNAEGCYEISADWELMPRVANIEQTEFTNLVKKEYAKTTILETAKAKGMEVEVIENEGNIEMVVSQW